MLDQAQTPGYLEALVEPHQAMIRGTILNGGVPDPRFGPVPLTDDGATTMDRTQLVRRKSTVTVADSSWVPSGPSSPLSALGLGMLVEYGIRSRSLPWTWTPIITAHILDGLATTPFAGVPVTLVDQMWRVAALDFDVDRTVKGSALSNLQALITECIPWAVFAVHPDVEANDVVMPATVFSSRASGSTAAIQTLARSIGADAPFTDAYGTVQIVPVPDPRADPVWAVRAGENGVLLRSQRKWSSENAPNAIRAIGQSKSGVTPISDLIADDDPTSPTYFYGVSSSSGTRYPNQIKKLTTVADTRAGCNVAARAAFLNLLGQSKSISLGSVANPTLVDGEVVEVLTGVGGVSSNHLPDSWRLAHDGSGMDVDSRAATLNDAGDT